MLMCQKGSVNLLPHFLLNSCSISHPAGGTCQNITTEWTPHNVCGWARIYRSTNCHISCPIAAVSNIRQEKHLRNSQQNITTEWTPNSVCLWAKMDRSTYCHISCPIAAVSATRPANHIINSQSHNKISQLSGRPTVSVNGPLTYPAQ